MSRESSARDRKLATVERLYKLELEQARGVRAVVEEAAAKQRRVASLIQGRIDETQAIASRQTEGGVSAEVLRQVRAYANWQAHLLGEQRERVREAESQVEEANAEVTQRFQAVSAMEKLRERRLRDAALEDERAHQRALDDHALLRAAVVRN